MSSASRHKLWAITPVIALVAWTCGSTEPSANATTTVSEVVISPPASAIPLDSTVSLQAEARDPSGVVVPNVPIYWTVRDANIARVSSTGVVSAHAIGVTEVAASSMGKSAVATITVGPGPVASVVVTPNPVSMAVDQFTQLATSPRDSKGNVVTGKSAIWSSSNTAIASVSPVGVVTAVGPGSTKITATVDGVSGTATATVTPGAAAHVTIRPTATTVRQRATGQLSATAVDSKGNPILGRAFAWTSSNTTIATVGAANGLVTGKKVGAVSIVVTLDASSDTASVTVIP
jgi:uncharacterized protein YjdB